MVEHARRIAPERHQEVTRRRPRAPQRRLEVGRADDPLEHEADRVADRVMRLLDRSSEASAVMFGGAAPSRIARRAAPGVQRQIENVSYHDEISSDDRKLADAFFAAYEKAVQAAYTYAVSVPSLGALAKLDGRTELWCRLWGEFVAGGRPKLMAAAFGYVVESLASLSDEFKPAPPGGTTVYTQVTTGGTRPDLVLRLQRGTREIAWIDLTASQSVDHIYSKESWDTKIGTYAEITYPSVTPATLAMMVQNKDNKGSLSQEEFDKRKAKADEEYRERKATWVERGATYYSISVRRRELLAKHRRDVLNVRPELSRSFIRDRLDQDFDTHIDEKMVPSILKAMDVNPGPWGFTTGYSVSERAGEAWLVDNDPSWNPTGPKPTKGSTGKLMREKKSHRYSPY